MNDSAPGKIRLPDHLAPNIAECRRCVATEGALKRALSNLASLWLILGRHDAPTVSRVITLGTVTAMH